MPEKSRSIHLLGSEVEASQFFFQRTGANPINYGQLINKFTIKNLPTDQTVNNVVKFAFLK